MQTNSNKTLKDRLDNLINMYLFDLEYDTPQEGDDTPFWQKEREIQSSAARLPKQDLEEVYQKYQKQNKELLSEIEWRRMNQKSPNPVREKVQKALADILAQIESFVQGTKENVARERQKEKVHIEQTISRPSAEKKSLVDVAIESGSKIFPEPPAKKEEPIEESKKEPEPKQKRKSFSSLPSKPQKLEETEEMVFEEALSSDDPILQKEEGPYSTKEEEGKTPEERIEKMVSRYLTKRPKLDWKERDRQEEILRKKLYQKEWEKKEERQKEEGKKAKTTTLKLWGKEDGKKKKSWWPF